MPFLDLSSGLRAPISAGQTGSRGDCRNPIQFSDGRDSQPTILTPLCARATSNRAHPSLRRRVDATSPALPSVAPKRGRNLHRFANPGRFLRLSAPRVALARDLRRGLHPGRSRLGPVRRAAGLAAGRCGADHVCPCARRLARFDGLCRRSRVCAVISIVWRHPLADLAALEIGPVGAAFTALCLATGSLWGKPMWGAWWVWDARLTSRAGAVLPLSRPYRADPRLRRSGARLSRRPRSWRWSARSTCRSSSSASIGGTRCTSPTPSISSAGPPCPPRCLTLCSSRRWVSRLSSRLWCWRVCGRQ